MKPARTITNIRVALPRPPGHRVFSFLLIAWAAVAILGGALLALALR
jgi:hypothetical protein